MAMERQQNPFDTPIPGQSLTDEPKNYVWENPARFSKVEDAATFIWEGLHKKNTLTKIILMLETGVSVEAVTRVIIFSGFIEGAFSVDTSILLTPAVQKMILAIGKAANIKEIKISKPEQNETKKILKDLYKTRNFSRDIEDKQKQDSKKTVETEKEKGLMSKEGDDS
tara:strand:+ start:1738 stop:2241 length:504 start_codon:yes stop_codon:yes gene_type:complete